MTVGSPSQSLTPQMADYDRLGQKTDWRPYLMFFQQPDFQSAAVTTDHFGFRPSILPDGRKLSPEKTCDGPINLLVGNSVSFGVGASCDAAALSSRLCLHSGQPWMNFGGRAFSAQQELSLFQLYHYKLPSRIENVVLFTGLNDLYLFYAPKVFDETFGIFFFSEHFYRSLNRDTSPLIGKRALLAALLRPIYGERLDYRSLQLQDLPKLLCNSIPKKTAEPEPDLAALVAERKLLRNAIIDHLSRSLRLWAMFSREFGFQLTYALQPMLPWLGKTLSSEEQALLDEQDRGASRWHRLLRLVLDEDHHQWYAAALAGLCAEHGIKFVDLNPALRRDGEWLFTDRVHMTDQGQDFAAKAVLQALSSSNGVV